MKSKQIFFISIFIGLVYFCIQFQALPLYGANWDEPVHFGRGQAILHYFLTREKDYTNLNPINTTRRSYYQHDSYSFTFFEQKFDEGKYPITGAGHPVVSDILASISNKIFYQKLNVVGDIESYHLYSVMLSSVLVGVLFFCATSMYGFFTGLITALSIVISPLFLGETRYNTKDVPEAVFYALTIFAYYQGVIKNRWKFVVLSSFFAGLGFGTKLNIVFAITTLGIWSVLFIASQLRKDNLKKLIQKYIHVLVAIAVYPIIPLIIYFGSWPILWKDPVNRFMYNIHYYGTVGTAGGGISEFNTMFGLNTYAIQWILYTTPLVLLSLAFLGFVSGYRNKKHRLFFILVVLWLIMPIVRVSLPGLVIYGGVRQIMEYIPALAILAGMGAQTLVNWRKREKNNKTTTEIILQGIIILSFLPITMKLISLYPNEGIYFNPLIGGVKGAASRNLPGWGNSLGSTYRQGVRWINTHAEPNAKLGFVYELRSNIALNELRSDIEFSNQVRSALQRKGEYIIGVTHFGTQESAYHREYLERFLIPVHTVKVDGVAVLKIWKNDMEHSKTEYKKLEEVIEEPLVSIDKGNVIVDVGKPRRLTKLVVGYSTQNNCTVPEKGYFQHSKDGILWDRESADFAFFPLASWFKTQPAPGVLQFLFAGDQARFIKLVILDTNSCLLNTPLSVQVNVI